MKHAVIAIFDMAEDGKKAAAALSSRGFEASAIHVTHGDELVHSEVIPAAAEIESGPLTGLLHRLSVLFGVEEPHLAHYGEAVRRRSTVIQVDAVDEAQAAAARDTLLAWGPVNIEDRVDEWQRSGWRTPVASAETSASTRPDENPRVFMHRQEISIAGVRVYGRVDVVAFDRLAEDFRLDYQTRYSTQGTTYEDFDPAYRYGHSMASDANYQGRNWNEVEPEARVAWEGSHPQRPWEQVKAAVRHAWDRATN